MNEAYYEILVARKKSQTLTMLKLVAAALAVSCVILIFLGFFWGIIPAVVLGVFSYLVGQKNAVEYEYLYVDKELQIDRIIAQSKRKTMDTLDLNELVILAPVRSHELDRYRNGNYKKADYSSKEEASEASRYMLIVSDKQIIFEPTEELVKTIRMFAPRKVFMY